MGVNKRKIEPSTPQTPKNEIVNITIGKVSKV